jgi:hypothetical protein
VNWIPEKPYITVEVIDFDVRQLGAHGGGVQLRYGFKGKSMRLMFGEKKTAEVKV